MRFVLVVALLVARIELVQAWTVGRNCDARSQRQRQPPPQHPTRRSTQLPISVPNQEGEEKDGTDRTTKSVTPDVVVAELPLAYHTVFPEIPLDESLTNSTDDDCLLLEVTDNEPFDEPITEEPITEELNPEYNELSSVQVSVDNLQQQAEKGNEPEAEEDLHWFRFGGVGRLYADPTKLDSSFNNDAPTLTEDLVLDRLKHAAVAVVGLGGVGSWTAEALCRSGVGHLVLMDLDDICVSSANRQLHALTSTIGQMKTQAMRERLLDIAPHVRITLIHDFVFEDNVQDIVGRQLDQEYHVSAVVDAIDDPSDKAALLAACVQHGLPVISCGNPTGRTDPTLLRCGDLAFMGGDDPRDSTLAACRDILQNTYKFEDSSSSGWNLACIYSTQPIRSHTPVSVSASFRSDGGGGTASFVTGSFGFVAASRVVDMIARSEKQFTIHS